MKKQPGGCPLSQIETVVKKAGLRLKPSAPVAPPSPVRRLEQVPPESDDELFHREMQGVVHANWQHDPVPSSPPDPPMLADPDLEERRLMEAAIDGDPALEVLDHPEYIEGWIGIAGKRYLPNLRNGMYSIQGQIDLHGLSREEARQAVEDFILRVSRFRSCCVKIIHGRGINSPNDRAILKEGLQRWLSMRRMSKHVVAYASAPLKDGGVGAIYVLLCRAT